MGSVAMWSSCEVVDGGAVELGGQGSGFWVVWNIGLGGFERDGPLWF